MAKTISKHAIDQPESKFHIKSKMTQTIMEKFVSIQHVQHNHHAKNHKQRSSFDMDMKMHKLNIQLCDTHCHTMQLCV